jgi:hypothetical protein
MTDANLSMIETPEETPSRRSGPGLGTIVLLVGILAVIGVPPTPRIST